MKAPLSFQRIRAVLLDMDGVLYRGSILQPHAKEFLAFLRTLAVPFMCVTNNSASTSAELAKHLKSFGITVPPKQIITSSVATRWHLERVARAGSKLFVIGMHGLRHALLEDGYFCLDEASPDYVVVGLDYNFSYSQASLACHAILQGAVFIGTNGDALKPTSCGVEPEAGALLAYIQAATGVKPTIVGKPADTMFRFALEQLTVPPEHALVVGDNLKTDVLGALAVGMDAVLVLNGVTDVQQLAAEALTPTLAVHDLAELQTLWESALRD